VTKSDRERGNDETERDQVETDDDRERFRGECSGFHLARSDDILARHHGGHADGRAGDERSEIRRRVVERPGNLLEVSFRLGFDGLEFLQMVGHGDDCSAGGFPLFRGDREQRGGPSSPGTWNVSKGTVLTEKCLSNARLEPPLNPGGVFEDSTGLGGDAVASEFDRRLHGLAFGDLSADDVERVGQVSFNVADVLPNREDGTIRCDQCDADAEADCRDRCEVAGADRSNRYVPTNASEDSP